jgi:hypothetical protein
MMINVCTQKHECVWVPLFLIWFEVWYMHHAHKCRVCKIVNYVRLDVYNKCKWIIFKNPRRTVGSFLVLWGFKITSGIWRVVIIHPYKDLAKSIYKPDMNYKCFNYPFIFWLHVWKSNIQKIHRFFTFLFPHFWQLKTSKNHFAFLILICSFCQDFVTFKKRLVGRCRKIGDHQ